MNREWICLERCGKSLWKTVLLTVTFALLTILVGAGCTSGSSDKWLFRNPYFPEKWTLAVVPFTNLSGSDALDTDAVTDEFYTELQQIGDDSGIQVIPYNRVLSAMHRLQIEKLNESDVTALAETLGVDAIIVGTISRYDPYPPPLVGMIVQLYDRKDFRALPSADHINPGDLARQGKSLDLRSSPDLKPTTMVIRIMDAGDNDVIERIKQYAREKGAMKSPSGWETYKTSRNYLKFVSHEVIGELLALQKTKL